MGGQNRRKKPVRAAKKKLNQPTNDAEFRNQPQAVYIVKASAFTCAKPFSFQYVLETELSQTSNRIHFFPVSVGPLTEYFVIYCPVP